MVGKAKRIQSDTSPKPEVETAKKRRMGGRSARVRKSVLEAAFEILVDEGLGQFSIAEVAKRSGVHETSIYRRWGTKEALATDACLHFADTAMPVPDTGSLRSDLAVISEKVANLLSSDLGRSMIALAMADTPESVEMRRSYWKGRFSLAKAVFERAKERGEPYDQVDPTQFLETLISPLYFRLLVSGEPISEWPIEAMIDRLLKAYR